MKNIYLTNKYKYIGKWWLATNSEKSIAGTLTLSPKGIKLEAIGEQAELNELIDYSSEKHGKIYGIASTGERITIDDAFSGGHSISHPGLCKLQIISNTCYVGIHKANDNQLTIKSALASFLNLETWLNYYPFEAEHDISNDEDIAGSIHYHIPKCMFNEYIDSKQLTISTSHTLNQSLGGYTKSYLNHKPYINFKINSRARVSDYLKDIYSFERLLTVLIGKTSSLNEACFYTDDSEQAPFWVYKPFHDNDNESIHIMDVIAPYTDIKSTLHKILNNWYQLDHSYVTATLLFHSQIKRDTYDISKFMNYMQALEVIARSKSKSSYLSKTEFKTIRKKLIDVLPDEIGEVKTIFSNKISFINKASFLSMLEEVVDKVFGKNATDLDILTKENLRKLINTRNYHTHYDLSTKDKSFGDDILFKVTDKLKLLVLIMLLDEAGIPASTVINKANKSFKWRYIFN